MIKLDKNHGFRVGCPRKSEDKSSFWAKLTIYDIMPFFLKLWYILQNGRRAPTKTARYMLKSSYTITYGCKH